MCQEKKWHAKHQNGSCDGCPGHGESGVQRAVNPRISSVIGGITGLKTSGFSRATGRFAGHHI